MKPVIKVNGVSKSLDGKTILKDLNLEIFPGELVCIIGQSGCGKTTLLNLLGGFQSADCGEICFNGKKVTRPSRQCIMVFQEFDQLFAWMTVRKNVEFPLKKSYSKKEISVYADRYLEMVRLLEFADYYPNQLSGGMKQRTALARALALAPEVLLMDEPFGSLDAQTKKGLQDTLLEIKNKTGATIVFVTHDIREALYLADRVVVVKAGTRVDIIDNRTKTATEKRVAEITALLSP